MDDGHFEFVANALLDGLVVPFLGAGVHLWDKYEPPHRPPSAKELALTLGDGGWSGHPADLLRVSQYVETMRGSGPLYRKLREVFLGPHRATPLYGLLADLPLRLRPGVPAPLMVTTNYDLVLEYALGDAGVEFDQVVYIANKIDKDFGRFRHVKWRKSEDQAGKIRPAFSRIIVRPNEYSDPDLAAGRYTVVLKIHGAVDDGVALNDSYVITEDDYIEYIARADASSLLPAFAGERLKNCHTLFLGYGLRDWNLRVLLRRIWGDRKHTWESWAVQKDCEELDRRFWLHRSVELIQMPLEEYTRKLGERLDALAPATPKP